MDIKFDNSYAKLPENFFAFGQPSAALRPKLVKFNSELSRYIGIGENNWAEDRLAQVFSGRELLEGSEPIAMAYAGHQFGHFVPTLGDGRALLLGEVVNKQGQRFDIQLKGSGTTAFSRRGDGKSSLGPVIREYLLCESMHALGIKTTRALAAVESGDNVIRESVLPGGIFARVASSHLRVGTFEYFAGSEDPESLKTLCEYAIQRHDPELVDAEDKYNKFFAKVCRRKLDLVASWMGIGFIHGVMNTDNTSISGETIDYGPCAFMDHFKFSRVYSFIDKDGRYAYGNQGDIALWNLSVLANALFPLLKKENESRDQAFARIKTEFDEHAAYFKTKLTETMLKKFGLFSVTKDDFTFVMQFLSSLEEKNADFTNSFRSLSSFDMGNQELMKYWQGRLDEEGRSEELVRAQMQRSNPVLIPRNHQIEKAIAHSLNGDYEHFNRLLEALTKPWENRSEDSDLQLPPEPGEVVKNTFCGT